jgi:hypothetical protein
MIVSTAIKDQIIAKIQNLDSVEVVYPAVKLNPKGFPWVYVTANTEEGEFSSNAENSRVYTYNCSIGVPIGQDIVAEQERERMDYAERTIAEVIDQIINSIDTDFELEGNPVLFVNAADVEWGYIDYEGGVARAANVILRVYSEITVI